MFDLGLQKIETEPKDRVGGLFRLLLHQERSVQFVVAVSVAVVVVEVPVVVMVVPVKFVESPLIQVLCSLLPSTVV